MKNHFLTYLKESLALNPPVSVKENEPVLGINTYEKSVRDAKTLVSDINSLKTKNLENAKLTRKLKKERASILKKYNLKIENNEIVSKEKDDNYLLPNISVTNNLNDFNDEIKNKIQALTDEIERNQPKYKKNLKKILKLFFTVNRKIPKRYIYLPVSNTLNFQEIEKINSNSHLDILLKIKNGKFAQLEKKDKSVFDYLIEFGYKLTTEQYIKNICVNANGKEVPIDKELTNIAMINIDQKKKALEKQTNQIIVNKINLEIQKKEHYQDEYLEIIKKVKTNSNINNNSVIILTWVPRLILLQSTNTVWDSCMRYSLDSRKDGINVRFVPTGIEAGVFIAWLVNLDDRKITKPIARSLLKPFTVNKNSDNYFYWPSSIYTTGGQTNIISMFKKSLQNYAIYKQRSMVPDLSGKKLELSDGVYVDGVDTELYFYDVKYLKNIINNKELLKTNNLGSIIQKTFDLTENDLEEILNNKNVENLFSNPLDKENNFQNIHALFNKAIEFKKPLLIKKIIDRLSENNKSIFLVSLVNALAMGAIEENRAVCANNISIFKYFLSLYDKNDKAISNNKFLYDFGSMNVLSHLHKNLGPIIKAMVDYFGIKLYNTQNDEYIKNVSYIFMSDLKLNEALSITNALKISTQKIFKTVISAFLEQLYKNNKNTFYYFYNNEVQNENIDKESKMDIKRFALFVLKYEKENVKNLEEFLDKTNFTFENKKDDETSEVIIDFYSQAVLDKDFNTIYKKLLKKNISIKNAFLTYGGLESITRLSDFLYNLYKRTEKESKELYNELFLYAISSSVYKSSVYHLIEIFLNDKENTDKIIEYVKTLPPKDSSSRQEKIFYAFNNYCFKRNDKKQNSKLMQILFDKNILRYEKNDNDLKYQYFYQILLNKDEEMYKKYVLENNKFKVSNIYQMFVSFAKESMKTPDRFDTLNQIFDFMDKHKEDIEDDTDFEFYKSRLKIDTTVRIMHYNFLPLFDIMKTMKDKKILNASTFNQFETYILNEIEKASDGFFINLVAQYIMLLPEKYFIKYTNNIKIKLQKIKEADIYSKIRDNLSFIVDEINNSKGMILMNLLDQESQDYFLRIIFNYIFFSDVQNISKINAIVNKYKCEKVLKDLFESYYNSDPYYNETITIKISNITQNIKLLNKYIDKEKILMFIIKNKLSEINGMNLLFQEDEFKNEKIQNMVFNMLSYVEDNYANYQVSRAYDNLCKIFSKKEIDSLIIANKDKFSKILANKDKK
jgi:hypothetical protein